MKTIIKKEIRLLLPAWVAAMLLAVVPMFFFPPENMGINASGGACITVFFIAGTILLAISPFGLESGFNTFSVMLAQPVQRRRIWDIKIALLLIGLLSVLAAFWLSWICHAYSAYTQNDWFGRANGAYFQRDLFDFMKDTAWWAVAIFAGGLWTSLLFRQIIAAFWITLITPWLLAFGVALLFDNLFPNAARYDTACILVVNLLYLVAGFFWARRLFFNAQDTQWTGGDISFQWRKRDSAAGAMAGAGRPTHWFPALFWKEVQLHQINLIIAAAILVLHVGSIILRKIHPRFQDPDIQFAIETVWMLWLVLPLLIGSTAVAEERKLGVAESQLCLPVTRRFQFWLKLVVALVLSVVFGAVMPSIIERTSSFGENQWIDYWIFFAATALFLVSFYASTLTRSTLMAIGTAIALPLVIGPVVFLVGDWLFFRMAENVYPQWEIDGRVLCVIFIAIVIVPLVLAGLMYWNFKWLHQNARLWRRNAAVLLLTFIFIYVACNAVFFRTWEWVMPLEPVHGPARLSAEQPPRLFPIEDRLVAAMPDGRLWQENIGYRDIPLGKLSFAEQEVEFPYLKSQRSIGGSNWKVVSLGSYFVLGIHKDGTLWCLPEKPGIRPDGSQYSEPQQPTQLGPETNWTEVVAEDSLFLLLKNDGSLWVWGTNNFNMEKRKMQADLASLPARAGDETNWVKLSQLTPFWGVAQKDDSSFWIWRAERNGTNFSRLAKFNIPADIHWTDQWKSYADHYQWSAGVSSNGESWFFYQSPTNWDGRGIPAYLQKVKLGSDSNWKAVMFSPTDSLILLRQDGTLWQWTFIKTENTSWNSWNNFQPEPFRPVQLGRQSDWIALDGTGWDDIALAADGSLWSWGGQSDHLWLAPSRKPVYMGNVFEGSGVGP